MSGPDDISTYIDTLPEPRRGDVLRLHWLLREEAPELQPKLWNYSGTLIGYGEYHYKGRSSEGDWFLLGLASRKSHVSLYSMAMTPEGAYYAESFGQRLGVKAGKSCLNLKKPAEISEDLLREFVRESLRLLDERGPLSS